MEYKTKDLYLATTLVALDYPLNKLEKEGAIFFFVFPKDPKLESEIDRYWTGKLLIDPMKLFNAFKTLKARMYNQT